MSCKAIGEVVINFVAFKNRKHLTHPFVVGSRPFQRRSLFSNVFAAVGMQEEADAPPQEESGRGIASEIEDADFSLLPMSEAVVDGSAKAAHQLSVS
jgi:hypothetical protein